MSIHQHATIEDTVYFWFGSNDTSGSGADGATPVYDVREAGAAAGAIPLHSDTATLLTHANYPAGCHEVAVPATDANGFAAGDVCGVFCTLAVDSQNPTGFVGSFTLAPIIANTTQIEGADASSAINAEVVDVMATDTHSLPGQEAMTATPTYKQMMSYNYKFTRNKIVTDKDSIELYDEAGTTVDQKATVGRADNKFTREEFESGP